jgi:isoquinoline 1-oxidoreductase beta subunit
MKEINRREFLKLLTTTGLTLTVIASPMGLKVVKASSYNKDDKDGSFVPNVWLHITEKDDVLIIISKSEMGQGVYTSLPQIIADELGADWEKINVFPAPARKEYIDEKMGGQLTGGSTSIRHLYDSFRLAGAAARDMLIEAAAKKWKIDKSKCYVKNGKVHTDGGKEISFGKLVSIAKTLTPPASPMLKDESTFELIGKAVSRIDTKEKVNGQAKFGIDIAFEGMCYASVKKPIGYGSKVLEYNIDQIKSDKGFIDAFKISSGLAIVAKDTYSAISLKEKATIKVSEPEMPDLDTKKVEDILLSSINKKGAVAKSVGNVDEVLNSSTNKITSRYLLPYLAHVNMEPMNCTVVLKDDECHIYVPTQTQSGTLLAAKNITKLPEEKIHIYTTYLGTGFGRRAEVDFVIDALEIAKKVKKPVKVIWTRDDEFKHDFYRPGNCTEITGAIDDKGNIVGWKHKIAVASIWERINPAMMAGGVDHAAVEGLVNMPYSIKNQQVEYIKVDLPIPIGFWRSVGSSHNAFTVESFIDELAYLAKKDSVEFRLLHLKDDKRASRLISFVAEKIGWKNEADLGYGIAHHFSFGSDVVEAVKLRVDEKTGKIEIKKIVAAVDCGKVVNPEIIKDQIKGAIVMGLSAALKEKMEFKDGGAAISNFYDYDILRNNELPEIEVYLLPSGGAIGGIGEPGLPPIAAALANAIFDATKVRIRTLPITPERFLSKKS